MQNLNNLLLEIFAYLRKYFKQTINHSQGRIIEKIILYKVASKPISIHELVTYTGLTQANISQILKKLETEKLIERKINKEDQRFKDVHITRKGQQLIKTFKKQQSKHFSDIFRNFDTKDKRRIKELLLELLTILKKYEN